ncbi:hypothetical protein NFI96_002826 [Prochilodus magdalenae]|nr:hypothetical protein NFI96_002826 [Prochilodus magdalenae]
MEELSNSTPVTCTYNTSSCTWSVVDINQTDTDFYLISLLLSCFYTAFLFPLGLVGNILILLVNLDPHQRRSRPDPYFTNLALADLVLVLDSLIEVFNLSAHYYDNAVLCTCMALFLQVNMYSSVFFLTWMSLDRCLALTGLTSQALATAHGSASHRSGLMCAIIWVAAIASTLLPFTTAHARHGWGRGFCFASAAEVQWLEVTLGFAVPFCVMGVCYALIGRALLQSRRPRRAKALRMIATTVSVFFVCWLPENVFIGVHLLSGAIEPSRRRGNSTLWQQYPLTGHMVTLAACTNSCLNPLVYSLLGKTFRSKLHLFLKNHLQCHHAPQRTAKVTHVCLHGGPRVKFTPTICVSHSQEEEHSTDLQSSNSSTLEAQVSLEILGDLPHQALEGQLADQKLSGLLVPTDLTKSHSTRTGGHKKYGPQRDSGSTQTDFHWKRSDNSFAFNFLPAAMSSLTHTTTAPAEAQVLPRDGEGSDTGSSFTFNFQIPTEQSGGLENDAVQAGKTEMVVTAVEPSADSSKSKAKKKKKRKGGGTGGQSDGLQKNMNKTIEEAPKQEKIELTPEEQLNRELDWCIEQLELGLRTQKSSTKQREEASRNLKTLRSSKAPMVKKRQVMRAVSGDYRRKMEEETNKQFKLIQSAMTNAKVTAVSEPSRKPVFHRRAVTKIHTASHMDKSHDTHGLSHAAEQTVGDMGQFVFRPSNEEFRFNFDLLVYGKMSELSDETSESEQLGASLSVWFAHSGSALIRPEDLDVPLDLYTACSIGQYDVVVECIRGGDVDMDGKNLGGWTPLMYAAYIGHDNIVNLLLESGVSVSASTAKGLTPLMLAASCGNESIAYFLLQQGAELECKDGRGWTALLHSTSTGHQQMVKFLLDNNANANVKEPVLGFTPLMEAAASGHEIIVQYLLDHGARVEERNFKGETARALAMMYGHTKIASLIDMHCMRAKQGMYEELSSSEEDSGAPRPRSTRSRTRGPSIHDGPQAIARFRVGPKQDFPLAPPGYMTFRDVGDQNEGICNRDVTSPINELDGQSNSSRDELFFDNDMPTIRSSSSSSEGLPRLLGLSREGSLESNEDSDQAKRSCPRRANKLHHSKSKSRHSNSDSTPPNSTGNCGTPPYMGPKDLAEFLEQIGFSKYLPLLEEQDIDLRIFLTLTENDLKEVGISLFGPKRKMTSAIARWHSNARPPSDALEQAYADKLEAEMQEMAIQLHKRCVEVESLQGQVSQEKELRTVMEGCLMEEKMAWRSVQAELRESAKQIQALNGMLHTLRNMHSQLAQHIHHDGQTTAKEDTAVCSEMLSSMESYEEKLGGPPEFY